MSSDEARAEAERRMHEQREQMRLMVVEQARFVEGFVQGAEWQAERDVERVVELEAKLDEVREFAWTQHNEIRGSYDMRGGAPAEYVGFANACEDILAVLDGEAGS